MIFILPVISVWVGYIVAILLKPKSPKGIQLLLAFSGAFLLALTFFELLPEVYESDNSREIAVYILIGILLQIFLEFFSKGAEHGHTHIQVQKANFPIVLFISLSLHALVEGVPIETFRETFDESGYYALLFIPSNILASESSLIYSTKQTSVEISEYLRRSMEAESEDLKLAQHDIEGIDKILAQVETTIKVRNIKWTKDGKTQESNTAVVMGLGYLSGMLIFFFIFFFGSQVMRGVIEEKVSRIIEVIVSSVKPFQLMMGKIIGVGLTGLTQFLIWMILSAVLVTGLKAAIFPELNQNPTEQVDASDL